MSKKENSLFDFLKEQSQKRLELAHEIINHLLETPLSPELANQLTPETAKKFKEIGEVYLPFIPLLKIPEYQKAILALGMKKTIIESERVLNQTN